MGHRATIALLRPSNNGVAMDVIGPQACLCVHVPCDQQRLFYWACLAPLLASLLVGPATCKKSLPILDRDPVILGVSSIFQ